MADNDAASTSSGSTGDQSRSSRRTLLGLRQLSDDTKHFFRDNYHKARNLRHRHGDDSPSSPSIDIADSPADSGLGSPFTPTKSSGFPFSPTRSSHNTASSSSGTASRSSNKHLPRVPQQPTPSLTSAQPRLHHISALRVGLTSLVVYHHTALPYGGLGSWGFQSAYTPGTSPILAAFNAFDQTFFMAGFFWVAGYFTYGQLRRMTRSAAVNANGQQQAGSGRDGKPTTTLAFVSSRAKRLVLPAVAYTVLAGPLTQLMLRFHRNNWGMLSRGQIMSVLQAYFTNLRGIRGPVWFCTLLFLLDSLAAGLSTVAPSLFRPSTSSASRPSSMVSTRPQLLTITSVAITTLASYFIRQHGYPIGSTFAALNLQPAFLPQYIFAYLAGQITFKTGELYFPSLIPNPRWRPMRTLAIALGIMTLGFGAVAGSLLYQHGGSLAKLSLPAAVKMLSGGMGGASAAAYALVNELGFPAVFPALLACASKYFSTPGSTVVRLPWWVWPFAWKNSSSSSNSKTNAKGAHEARKNSSSRKPIEIDLSRYAYATLLLHPIVSLGVELAVERFVLPKIFGAASTPSLSRVAGRSGAKNGSGGGGGGGWLSKAVDSSSASSGSRAAAAAAPAAASVDGQWWLPPLLTVTVGTVNLLASWVIGIGALEGMPVLKRWI